ncbi:MAG TPA: polysaccharide deacetylase family protein [Candidatus Obscuribacterales bacterium]
MAEANRFSIKNLWEQVRSAEDDFCLRRMDYLTDLARKLLPDGFWGDNSPPAQGQETLYLTFDDGPCPHVTPWLLELLEEQNVRATFFLVGARVASHEHLVEKIVRAGHAVGNHTFNHFLMPALSTQALEKEIDRTNALIADLAGVPPQLFRPPYGLMDQRGADCLKERNMRPVYWGPVPEDWAAPGPERVVNRVMRRLSHGALVVLHEHRLLSKQTLAAAKQIICSGRQLGYTFAAVR